MPVDFRIRLDTSDVAELNALLGRIAEPPKEALDEGAAMFRQLMSVYPPERPGSTYVRTRRLGNSWRVVADASRARVRNDVPYAVFVQGSYRRWFHKDTGWKTPREMWNERGEVIKAAMRRGAVRAWSKKRL